MQNGFTRKEGSLYINGAQDIIGPINKFLCQIKEGVFDYSLIVFDTHFTEEYYLSEESKKFPIHCEFGTNDWNLSVDVSFLTNKRYFTKNKFNMWSEEGLTSVRIIDPMKKAAYDNLFYFLDDPYKPGEKVPRDEFIRNICQDHNTDNLEVTIIGVASDYCNRYAMEGWLLRGASVIIIQDLTKGIEKETEQILAEYQYKKYINGRLRFVDSAGYLKELTYI